MTTELAKAEEALRAAEARVMDVLRTSTRALIDAGFMPTVIRDPRRLAVLEEIVREDEENAD